ncbi:hypothetical protein AB0I55_12210 [Actinocatenispora sera]|uniref:hypothetical protein n=1 Tax=Actinocatenispora sera TaxID=390989 RepID=UPI0033CDA725
MTVIDDRARRRLLRRGYALESVTLGWNMIGIAVLAVAAVAARSVALALYLAVQSALVLATGFRSQHCRPGSPGPR